MSACPTMPVRLVAGALVAVGLVVGAGACGSPTVDPQQLSADLSRDVAKLGPGTTITCPEGQPATSGTAFTCVAATPMGPLVYDVTITSDTGDYRYQLAPGQVVDGAGLAAELTAQIKGSDPALASVTVSCPASILAPGGTVAATCTVVAGTAQLPVQVSGPPGAPLTWAFTTA